MAHDESKPEPKAVDLLRRGSAPSLIEKLALEIEKMLPPPRGTCAADLFRLLHARTPPAYFARISEEAIAEAIGLFDLIEKPQDGFQVRVTSDGTKDSRRERVALETAGRDQPFIYNSLLEVLRVRGLKPRDSFHPIVAVRRDAAGRVLEIGPPASGAELVSVIRIEIEGAPDPTEREGLVAEASAVLKEARLVAQDFEPMLARLHEIEERLLDQVQNAGSPGATEDLREAVAFLNWIRRANFVFLGFRGYDIHGTGAGATLEVRHGSGLGILRDEARSSYDKPKLLSSLTPDLRERVLTPRLLLVHKTNAESRVLRRTRMDYIGVKRIDPAGNVVGEDRFLGLFTARAYNDLPSDIPILRKKLDDIVKMANLVPGSHDHKEVFSIFTSIPKSELFVTETTRIAEMIFAIMSSSGRRDVRVSYRPDFLERGVSVMVLMPREKFNADVRGAIQGLLAAEFRGTPIDYRLALSDEPMARLHFYFATKPGERPSPPLDELEAKVSQLIRTWDDRLREALEAEFGPDEAVRIAERYRKAFPASYVAVKNPDTAVADIQHIDSVLSKGRLEVAVAHTRTGEEKKVSVLKFYREAEPFALSTLMPILTHLGLHVLDEQTFRVTPLAPARGPDARRGKGKAALEERSVYLHSFRLVGPDSAPLLAGKVSRHIEEILPSLIAGDAVDDGLNALIPRAGLDWRQTKLLRAYDAYLHQLGSPWTQRTKYAALCDNPGVAALLVKLFEARFDPRIGAGERGARVDGLRADIKAALERVTSILEDEILRSFESLVTASVRTNHFCRDAEGRPLGALAIKLRCMLVRAMPDPRPLYEIFVHSAAMEGVHLRSGKVARGGIRWSSRIDDYRMEILSLMRTQRTKNSVIVPVGAKGGFIVKRGGASPPPEEIRAQYEVLVKSLLDVTDNVVDGKVEHPRDVVVHDEPDPYLVVAADRGTATFSDIANAIAVSRSFWLGDAFASGGSRGYDHKKEGITARGAWELVRRHFRELGIDPDQTPFTVVGIGDMSGDVFGNGMIYSGKIRLIAAFNHAHIFLDPAPDPRVSFEERRRLFGLPRSAWTDYDPSKISPGGAVFRRDAKSIKPSLEARSMLGVASESLNGDELVKAILVMRTDLLWNGGIGTYVKARTESHLDVSDPANDAVRVDGADLRARVVAEGGNLGFTQLGRIEYARANGRINTDAIDNSAGVDLSDHEVNLKILLARAKARGALEERERDEVLRSVAETVTRQVLRDNYLQGLVLSIEERKGVLALDDHRLLIGELSSGGLLNRAVERMPEDVDLGRLRESGTGLTRPQLAVLLAYAKIDAYTKVLASSLPAETDMDPFLVGYFPREIAERFADDVHNHPLRGEIAATTAVNAVINTMGISFFHRFSRRTGASFDDILRAWLVAADLAGESAFQASMDKLYAEGFSDMDAFYQGHSAWIAALENVVVGILRRGLGGRSAREAVHEHRKKLAILEELAAAEKDRPPDGRKLPESIVRSITHAEALAERMDLADLLAEAPVPPLAAARIWKEAAGALLLGRVEQATARMVPITAEEIQTRASLLEEAREQHRRLAGLLLRRLAAIGGTEGNDPGPASCQISPNHSERARAARILDAAETSEPLTPSGLFVVVEALGRLVDGVSTA